MKYASKQELLRDCETEWNKLMDLVATLDDRSMNKRLGSGSSARSIKDHFAHLYCWHRLLLAWTVIETPDLPLKGFKWSQTRELNQQLFEEFKNVEVRSMVRRLKRTHGKVMKLTRSMSQRQLFESGQFEWTGKHGLVSYIAPNTASHYRWAQKKIKKMIKAST